MLLRLQRTCLNRNSWSVLRTQSSLFGDIYIHSSPFEGGLIPPFFFTFCLFPRAAGTDHHTSSSSKQLAHSSESQESEKGLPGRYQGIGRLCSFLEALGKNPFLAFFRGCLASLVCARISPSSKLASEHLPSSLTLLPPSATRKDPHDDSGHCAMQDNLPISRSAGSATLIPLATSVPPRHVA